MRDAAPSPNADEIRRTLTALYAPDQIVELRALVTRGRKRTHAGYFDAEHREQLVSDAVRLNRNGAAVYTTLNRIDPQLLGRYANRMQEGADATTTDANILRREWLLVDVDPRRPKDTSATDAQREAAQYRMREVAEFLHAEDWPEAIEADSGNGFHLLYRIALPNDAHSTELLKRILLVLGSRFDDAQVSIDPTVFNASRIVKLHGTTACKGDHLPATPHRVSRLLRVPAPAVAVALEQLQEVAALHRRAAAPPSSQAPHEGLRAWSSDDVSLFLTRHGVEFTGPEQHESRERWRLIACPFDASHGKGEAAVFREYTGRLGFKCQHQSCAAFDWKTLRQKLDPAGSRRDAPPRPGTSKSAVPAAAAVLLEAPQPEADDEHDPHRNAPRPDPACLYGLVGEVARAGSETTEANAYAVALNFIAYLSAALGRGSYLPVGNTRHHPLLFGLHAGRTSRGRKGDAASFVHRLDMAIRKADRYAAPQVHRGGLSSREGLALLIHDGFREGKREVEPIHDKRLWVIESEFANILQQSKRDGNTLSAALRDAWDGVSIRPATKSSRVWASDPHIALSGGITPSELRSLMASRELTNGFANRFLMIFAERDKLLPFPKATPQHVVDELARRTLEVIEFAGGTKPVEKDVHQIDLSAPAVRLYASLYRGELSDQSAGELVGAMTERRAPMLLRLAMLFALCDQTREVAEQHIHAAMAWVRYSVESVKFMFASSLDEADAADVTDLAEKVTAYLSHKGRATRTEINADCFQRHQSRDKIDAALDELLAAAPPRIVVETIPRPKGNPGSPTKFYRPAANSANSAKREDWRGLAVNSHDGEISELCEIRADLTSHS